MNIDSIRGWCTTNRMKSNVCKTNAVSFTRKANMIPFQYKLCESRINRLDTVKDLRIILGTNRFHHHVDYICLQSVKLLDLIRIITCYLSFVGSFLTLYFHIS
jgi:hypothetical protein